MKIGVSFSGGVDSTITALILKKINYRINCFYLENNIKNELKCCNSEKEILNCLKILPIIKSKIKIINITKIYIKKILKLLIKKYKKGFSINPDIICNNKIKFKYLIKKKKYIFAFGHYVKKKKKFIEISRDIKKDQTYFIYKIINKKLKRFFFPLEYWKKKEVKYFVKYLNIICNQKTTGICFINNRKFFLFIKKYIKSKGKIINKKKKTIYKYKNLFFKTIGQKIKKKEYIYKKKKKNIFVVNSNKNTLLYTRIFNINFFIKKKFFYYAKCNSRSNLKKFIFLKKKIKFIYPVKKINIGQSIVVYKNKKCIGGGEVN
ncbi:aminomethyltransferase beta-barrel domain-containing protein [Candidatus Vidania fulgoroideorum]